MPIYNLIIALFMERSNSSRAEIHSKTEVHSTSFYNYIYKHSVLVL